MSLRVVQWCTGIVGTSAVRAMLRHPGLEVVGCFAYSEEKRGADVGSLCGVDPIGVEATDDVEALLALRPDCVLYNPLFPDVEEMVRILEAGINLVSTSYFITGRSRYFGTEGIERLEAAARRGGVSLYGSGVNPGFANTVGLLATGVCQHVTRVSVLESVDCTHYASAETWEACGLGRPIDDPEIHAMARSLTAVFEDAVDLMARALRVELDEIHYESEFAVATHKTELGFMTIDRGCAAGIRHCWSGRVGGHTLIELPIVWTLGYTLEPKWPIEDGYVIEVDGLPSVRSRVSMVYPQDSAGPDFGTVTAMPAVHAMEAVCAAEPGIVLAHELPMTVAASVAGPPR
ncbi:dihydrodipicolinate reductase [Myxococcota bacterium]|nr:dihydrodipicolinate reductase [Myxococcota bacterium]